MLEINGSTIRLTKGDTAHLNVSIANTATGENYEMQENDLLFLTIRRQHYTDSPVLVQKKLTGSSDFTLLPEDTARLTSGTYCYDVELRTGNEVFTIIQCSDFELLPEVTTQ